GLAALADLLVHHLAAVAAGSLRRQPPRLRAGDGRISDPAAAGWRGQPDDRAGAVGFLLRCAGLADRLGGDGRPRAAAPAAPFLRGPRAQAGGGGHVSRAALLRRWLLRGVLIAGLMFFYAPIVSVVLFSFNSSTSAAVWSGFSLRWYQELLGNDNILRAAKLSV